MFAAREVDAHCPPASLVTLSLGLKPSYMELLVKAGSAVYFLLWANFAMSRFSMGLGLTVILKKRVQKI